MKKIKLFAFIIFTLISWCSNSYAALITYNGAAYWGKSHFWTAYPNDPRYEDHPEYEIVPYPTEFTPGRTAEDILANYGRYRGPSPFSASSSHVSEVCLGYYPGTTTCWKFTYHWAATRSIDCEEPNVPNQSFTDCIVPPPPPTNPPPAPEEPKTAGPPPPCKNSPSPVVGEGD